MRSPNTMVTALGGKSWRVVLSILLPAPRSPRGGGCGSGGDGDVPMMRQSGGLCRRGGCGRRDGPGSRGYPSRHSARGRRDLFWVWSLTVGRSTLAYLVLFDIVHHRVSQQLNVVLYANGDFMTCTVTDTFLYASSLYLRFRATRVCFSVPHMF